MLAAFAFAALLLQPPPPPPTLRAVQERLASCGIARDRVTLRYERELRQDVLVIAGRGVPSPETLDCAAHVSVETGRLARFDDPDADTRFGDAWADLVLRRNRETARQRLREAGRPGPLPRFDRQRQTLAQYGIRLEAFCGILAGAALRVHAGSLVFVDPDALGRLDGEQRECIADAAVASDADVILGFVGNEATAASSEER